MIFLMRFLDDLQRTIQGVHGELVMVEVGAFLELVRMARD